MNQLDTPALVLLAGLLFFSLPAKTQQPIRVKADTAVDQAVSFADRYQYPQFTGGSVVYRNGAPAAGRLNYNRLLGEIQFIAPMGDTLALADEQRIEYILIGTSRYVPRPGGGWLEEIARYGSIGLARQLIWKSLRSEKKVAYGQSSGASAVATVQPFANNSSVHRIESSGDQMIQETTTYFFIDGNQRYHLMKKSIIFKAFPKHKRAIDEYLSRHSIRFSEEADLKKLLQFCAELP